MQFESIKAFCDLTETRSFTKAAQINGVTQSAISQTISTLERQFHKRLVVRGKRNFRLTREGEVFYDFSKETLQTYDTLQGAIKTAREHTSILIRLASIYSFGLHDLPLVLKKFLNRNPTVKVNLEYGGAKRVYAAVLESAADLGLVAYPIRHLKLQIVPLRKDPLVLICAPDHPFAARKGIKLKMLNGQKFISIQRGIPTGKALNRILSERRIAVQLVQEFDNIETVKRAVEIGSGVAIVPEQTARQEVANKTLVAIQLEGGDFSRPLAIIHKKTKVLAPPMKTLIALLKEPV
jgi:LysR family transcriptional regulator, transcriptional activator of the cysJI operon